MTLDDATELAMQTEYAHEAIQPKGNEINTADAGAFFLEGALYAAKLCAEIADETMIVGHEAINIMDAFKIKDHSYLRPKG